MLELVRDCNYEPVNTIELCNIMELNKIMNEKRMNQNFLKVFHQNIRSIAKNFDEIMIFLDQLDTQFDVIVLTETFQGMDYRERFSIQGYRMLYNEGDFNRNDGVIVYLKEDIYCKHALVQIAESRAVQAEIKFGNKSTMVTALYRSPSSREDEFVVHLEHYLKQVNNISSDYHVIIGDMNIDTNKENELVSCYLNTMSEHGYFSMVNENTREQGESRSCIDHIFLRMKNLHRHDECFSGVFDTSITDHKSTMLGIPCKNTEERTHRGGTRTCIKYESVRESLRMHDWSFYYSLDTADKQAYYLTETLSRVIAQSTITMKIRKSENKRKKWITAGLVKSISKKNALHREYKEDPQNNWKKQRYLDYRSLINKLIKIAKRDFYQDEIKNSRNSSKQLWETVKGMNTPERRLPMKDVLCEDGTRIKDDILKADLFNRFFANIGRQYAEKIKKPPTEIPEKIRSGNSFFLTPVDDEEIIIIINSLKSKKSVGIDGIQAEDLKEVAREIAPLLTFLVNGIFQTGQCPQVFKKSIVTPIFKSGNQEMIENYRPISLVTNMSKIFEKALKTRLVSYVEKHDLISRNQFGFRSGMSTNDAIAALTGEIYGHVDQSRPAMCVFLDLARAFDTVDHKQLLETLHDYGIRGNAHQLFESYLKGRTQVVKINGSYSSEAEVVYGIPQGTVIGPLLFLIYMDGVLRMHFKGSMFGFADDTAILFSADSWADLKLIVEHEIGKIKDWFDHRLLTINFNKTHFIPFSSYENQLPEYNRLTINNHGVTMEITRTDNIKYLGVTIDSHLRWDVHICQVSKTLRYMLYKFRYLRSILDITHLKIVYYALVQSRLQYGILSWGGILDTHLTKMEVLQRRILKIMYNRKYDYSSDLVFGESQVLDIRQLYVHDIIVNVYRNRHSLRKIDHEYGTRHKVAGDVQVKKTRKAIGQRNYTYLGNRIFNYLPEAYRTYISTNSEALIRKIFRRYLLTIGREVVHGLISNN